MLLVPPPKPLTRARAWTCVLVNQLATPGLGSLWGGRRLAGTGQLTLALIGFALIVVWMYEFIFWPLLAELEETAPTPAAGWMLEWGAICFGAAWLWSLFTSISLLRQARREDTIGAVGVPPSIAETPPQDSSAPR